MPTAAEAPAREPPPARPDARRLSPAAMVRLIEDCAAAPAGRRSALLVARLDPAERVLVTSADAMQRRALSEAERRVASMLRTVDRYAFASREELWLLLPDLASEALARLAAHALRERLRRPVLLDPADGRGPVLLRPAIGGAWLPSGRGLPAAGALAAAWRASSLACDDDDAVPIEGWADAGGASPQPGDQETARVRQMLEANALEIRFQPKVDLRTGRCRAAEALVRWPSDVAAPALDPGTIVAVCEQRGLVGALTRFTLNATLRHMAAWRASGFDAAVAVNLSAAMLAEPTLPIAVAQSLDTWGVPADRLTLELTESALIRDEGTAGEVMRRLRELGARLSIDDFGTGYSPFTYLRRFPVHELKIDRDFVAPLARDPSDRAIVSALVELAHAFGMQVVAEGVEDARTARLLAALGCDLGQGWHYAAAMAPEAFPAWCAARDARAGAR